LSKIAIVEGDIFEGDSIVRTNDHYEKIDKSERKRQNKKHSKYLPEEQLEDEEEERKSSTDSDYEEIQQIDQEAIQRARDLKD
jgi:hypothetical protein